MWEKKEGEGFVSYLARRRDIDEGGVLMVVVLVRGGVGSLGRGQRLSDACKWILIKTSGHVHT